ncbi:AzlD domain-containing protein [Kribbella sp. NPDC050470]|uniref:AzlD domain-containing protein n=1 Tax=unclassified Kribbella TaxID=2644121 RepID=UPI0037B9154A
MPSTSYVVAVLAIVFTITLALRAVPFAILRTLRTSTVVQEFALWMPVGILAVLAAAALHTTVTEAPGAMPYAILAVGVTAAAHLLFGRRTILSVGIGTTTYVVLVNAVPLGGGLG